MAVGPNSDVTVVVRWSAAVTVEGQVAEEDTLLHPQIVLMDPTFTLVAEELLTLESGEQVKVFIHFFVVGNTRILPPCSL